MHSYYSTWWSRIGTHELRSFKYLRSYNDNRNNNNRLKPTGRFMKHYHYHYHFSHYYCHHHHYMMKDDEYVGSLLLTALRGGQSHHAQSDQTAAEHEERHQHIYPIVKHHHVSNFCSSINWINTIYFAAPENSREKNQLWSRKCVALQMTLNRSAGIDTTDYKYIQYTYLHNADTL